MAHFMLYKIRQKRTIWFEDYKKRRLNSMSRADVPTHYGGGAGPGRGMGARMGRGGEMDKGISRRRSK